ncbi:MAG: response regulator [Ignavibacteria bacterium]|jgi:DNA-binding response OmpR family regulator|nr:response regulator [Ignavibacteria bacterium]MBK9229072.1 response regulator [Ignavibacteria bacterium]
MSKKILIIDDDPDIVESTKMILESEGYEVISESGPEEGFASAVNQTPDLIILDVMMIEPDDGFFVASKIKSKLPDVPIIMYSSVSNALGYDYGMNNVVKVDMFIDKPVEPSVLLEAIGKLIKGKKG